MRTGTRFRAGLTAAALTIGAGAGIAASSTPASAAAVRGLNLTKACNVQNSEPGVFTVTNLVAELYPNWPYATHWTVYSWRCVFLINPPVSGINMNKACQEQYGPSSSAYFTNVNDPYSWRCR